MSELQNWLQSVGILLTGLVALAAFVQSVINGKTVRRVERATNGMKKELEEKAFQAGARSTEVTISAADLIARATETAALAAGVVAEAAKTAADLVKTTEQTRLDNLRGQ